MAARISSPSFIGRERELVELHNTLSQPPAVILVEGEAGVGKTRLVHELLVAYDGSALVAGCPPLREPFTLGPLVDAVRTAVDDPRSLRLSPLAGALRPLLPEWAAGLPPALEPLDDGAAARHRVFRALAELLGALEVGLLVVEDAHWADQTTLDFLLFLQSRQPATSLLVTFRPDEVPSGSQLLRLGSRLPSGTTPLRLALESLDVSQTAELVSSMLQGEEVSGEFATFLHRRTEGLPLAVEEVVRLMHDRADLTRRGDGWVRRHLDAIVVVPQTVRDAVLERTGRLGPDAQAVLRAASVLTDPADEPTLVAVSGLPAEQAAAGIDEAVDSGLLREHDRGLLGFRHVLASWAVYEAVPGSVRRALHLRAGEALEPVSPPPLVRLARHFREAGEIGRWCQCAEQAAEVALASGAAADAATLLHDLVAGAGLSADDLVRLADKLPHTTPQRYRDLVAALRAALDLDLAVPVRAEVRFQLGHALSKLQEYDAGRAELELAIPDLGHDPLHVARAMVLLGWPVDEVQPASAHLNWLRRAADVLPPPGSTERIRIDTNRVSAFLLLGDPSGWSVAAGLPDHGETYQARRLIGGSHLNVSHLATMWGRYDESRRRMAAADDLARADEMDSLTEMVEVNRAHLDLLTGRWDGLVERTEALAANEDLSPMGRNEAELIRERLRLAVEPPATADSRLVALLAGADRRGATQDTMEPAAMLARLRLDTGRAAEAVDVSERPIRVVERKGLWTWVTDLAPVRVEALIACGRIEEAVALARAFEAGLGDLDAPAPRASQLLCRALVTDTAAAYEAAAAAWDLLPRPYDVLLARERQARCLLRDGRTDEAAELLISAFEGLSGLGARPAAARVAETLRGLDMEVSTPWRGGRRGYGDQLSPRELDVVRLLVGGGTNREIAQALFLSPKTVARHLNSAMRKLGVSSRTALAVRVIEGDELGG